MQIEHLPLSELTPYARNARLHGDRQVSTIARSITEFGFVNPVLVDSEGTIIAGHGRVLAAEQLDDALLDEALREHPDVRDAMDWFLEQLEREEALLTEEVERVLDRG